MKIGLIGAMPEEISFFKSFLSKKKKKNVGNSEFIEGSLNKNRIILGFSRCGKVAAADVTAVLIHVFKVEFVIFIGVAGSADPSLNTGDIVIASNLIQYDMDGSASRKCKKFEIPFLGVSAFEVNHKYLNLARKTIHNFLKEEFKKIRKGSNFNIKTLKGRLPKVICGLIGTGDQFIADKEKIRLLREELPDLKCVEMEGAAVAQICFCHNIPFLVIRTISDKADKDAHLEYPGFANENGTYLLCNIAKEIIAELKI